MQFEPQRVRWLAITCMAALASIEGAGAQGTAGPVPQIIVKWKQQQANLAEQRDGRTRALRDRQDRFGLALRPLRFLATGSEVIRLGRAVHSAEMQRLLADLANDPAVEYAEVDRLLQPMFVPNDEHFHLQWYSFEASGGMNLPAAWDSSTGAGLRVAVVDTGVRPHPDLLPNLVGGYDFISDPFIANDGNGRDSDPEDPGNATAAGVCAPAAPAAHSSWHGTLIAGIIGAVANNGSGVAGTAFGAQIVPIRVVGRCGALLSDVVDGAIWAAGGAVPGAPLNWHRAKVINLALAAPGPCDATAQAAVNALRSLGAAVVVAAGNFSSDVADTLPANCANVITVGATTRNGTRAPYSNFGPGVDVAAPGGDLRAGDAGGVFSTHNDGTTTPGMHTIGVAEGTSMATAHAAGVLALLMSRYNLKPDVAEAVLKSTARPFPAPCSGCGAGIVDARAAVQAAARMPPVASLRGGASVTQLAGFSPAFTSDSMGDIVDYRLRRRTSTGVDAEEYRSTTGFFGFQIAPLGCVGETMVWTLTVVDRLGRTSSFAQSTTFVRDPAGGGIGSMQCGQ